MMQLQPIAGIPAVSPGDDLAAVLHAALERADLRLVNGDIVVVCQKIVSKAEGRIARFTDVTPSPFAETLAAATTGKDPRIIEIILRETTRIVRMDRGHLIVETGAGWVCANAGVDESNSTATDSVILLPADPDASAGRLRQRLRRTSSADVAVQKSSTNPSSGAASGTTLSANA